MIDQTQKLDNIIDEAVQKHRAGDLATAGSVYDAVLEQNPDHAEALHLKGVLLGQQGHADGALKMLDRAANAAPSDPRILGNRAKVLLDYGDVAGAIADYRAALEILPDDPNMHFNVAGALAVDGKLEDAIHHLETACRVDSKHARALANLGNLYRHTGRLKDSARLLERAIESTPDDPQVQHSLGVTLSDGRRYEAAAACFQCALELDKGFVRAAAQLFFCNLHSSDWKDHAKFIANFERMIESEGGLVSELSPLIALFLPIDQASLNRVSDERAHSLRVRTNVTDSDEGRDKLHVGYISADLGSHPVGYLSADILGHHDRKAFKVSAISLTPPDRSDVQQSIFANVDKVLDVSRLSAADAANQIRNAGVDILIDLGGFTRGARPEILAARAAPLQLGWLGYCGSAGGLNDALLADQTVLPEVDAEHFSEAVAYLPGSFMPLNNFVAPSTLHGSREEHGLPENGFVFCAFNAPTKIDPKSFDCWMNILMQVEGSVLWLREHTGVTTRNLERAALDRGVDPARLIFAPMVDGMEDHLARHRHADMFLDTFVYGAHSTAADA
ncbi:MAG: tetratricopeptide repeat protein, partial [Alphaproteobacteria bacterium]|nr:tetratricopeptide repeat protein [Alphaproteobacteria bacterium]